MTRLPSLVTQRLLLRPFRSSDAAQVEQRAGVFEVADTTLHIPHPYPAGAAVGWIAGHEPAWAAGERLTLAVTPIERTDEIMGAIGLALDGEHAGELGYWIARELWGRGFATEAARAMIAYGFGSLGLHRIRARHFLRNPASGRVMQKVGMRLEGVRPRDVERWGRAEDQAVYVIDRADWATPGAAETGPDGGA